MPQLDYQTSLETLITLALEEDIGTGDVTTQLTVSEETQGSFVVRAREACVMCGQDVAPMLLKAFKSDAVVEVLAKDGERLEAGAVMLRLSGSARDILTIERILLNFLQRLSGIATHTRAYVEAVAGTGVQILDTRKTLPGWRFLEKYAVKTGGGTNHRMGVFDAVMIKDNHIAACGGITQAVQAMRDGGCTLPIQVECDTMEQVQETLALDVRSILLDNMAPDRLKEAMTLRGDKSVRLEASGGITLETIVDIARVGIDDISIGAITHSAPTIDIGLDEDA